METQKSNDTLQKYTKLAKEQHPKPVTVMYEQKVLDATSNIKYER